MAAHSFTVGIASKIGLENAIILEHLYFWHQKNKGNNKNFHDGHYWTYNSINGFKEMYPYMSDKKIRNVLKQLKKMCLIVDGNYNKMKYDRTKWYALTEDGIALISHSDRFVQRANGIAQKANGVTQKGEPIPYNNTDNKTYKERLSDLDIEKILQSYPKKIDIAKGKNHLKSADVSANHIIEKIKQYVAITKPKYLQSFGNWICNEKWNDTYIVEKNHNEVV